MPVCPACEAENLPDSPACRRCGLAAELFEPIRAAVGIPKEDPRYERQVRALIAAMGELAAGPVEPTGAEIAAPARFPALSGARPPSQIGGPTVVLRELPQRPALPRPGGVAELRHRIDEYLRLAHRLGLDEGALDRRSRELAIVDDRDELDRFATDLFVRIAATLTDACAQESERRGELAELLPTVAVDEELGRARTELEQGEVERSDLALRKVVELLDRLEEEWGPATLLLLGAGDLAATIRDLGGDPAGALGPLDEGRRLIRNLERARAESVLARATLGLWTILNPLLEHDLTRRVSEVRSHREAGANVEPILNDLREFAEQVKRRNFAAAVAYYRRGVDRLTRLGAPTDAPVPALKSGPSVPPP